MARRKVEVELILDARNYLDEALRIDSATGKLDDSIADLGDSVDDTEFSMKELAKTSKKSSTELGAFGSATEATKKKIAELDQQLIEARKAQRDLAHEYSESNGDEAVGKRLDYQNRLIVNLHNERLALVQTTEAAADLGVSLDTGVKKTNAAAEALKALDARLVTVRQNVRKLTIEFGATGDATVGKDLDSERSVLGKLTRLRGELVDLAQEGAQLGGAIGSNVSKGLSSSLNLAGPLKQAMIGSLIAGAVVAAPLLAAIIGGVIAGGVGTLGVAAGIFAAAKDDRVSIAIGTLGEKISAEFFKAGESFVEPSLRALDVLDRAVDDTNFGDTLEKAAPYVEIIATGLGNLLRNIMPGLDRTMGRLGPFADVAAEGFGDLGAAIGGFVDDATASEGAVEGLETAFRLVNGTIIVVGRTIYALSEAFDWLLRTEDSILAFGEKFAMPGLGPFIEKTRRMIDNLRDVPESAGAASKSFDRFGEATDDVVKGGDPFVGYLRNAQRETAGLNNQLHDLFDVQLTVDQAQLRWQQDLLGLTESIKQNGRSLDTNTQLGLTNRGMILGMIDSANDVREATYKQTDSVVVANQAYARQIEILKENLRQLGYTKAQIDGMIGDYYINVNINTNYTKSGSFSQQQKNLDLEDLLLGGRASGGPVGPGLWKVGEQGPEILEMGPGQQGYVHPNSSWQAAGPSGGWQAGGGGGGTLRLELIVSPAAGSDSRVMSAITEGLQFSIQKQSGGDVQVHLGSRGF